MNPLPPNADELVSAYLDGEAAPDEVAIVESTPELMERVEALRSVSDLLAAPVDVPPEQKEAHISAALDAFDALFAAEAPDDNEAADVDTSPRLTVAPPPAPEQASEPASAVTSLTEARERRRPRRFNTGVIAAAVAAVLLFVAVAAFGFGSGDSADVATSAAADTASDAGDDAMEEAMEDEEDAMSDDAAGSALSELQAAPAPTALVAPEAARAESAEVMADEEAMDDDEAMDDEEAMDDAVDADQESAAEAEESAGAASDDAADANDADFLAAEPFLFADLRFPDLDSLLAELDLLSPDELQQRALLIEPGLFPGCQAEVAVLAGVASPTLVDQTFIDDAPVEIHQITADDGTTEFVIVDSDCMILATTP